MGKGGNNGVEVSAIVVVPLRLTVGLCPLESGTDDSDGGAMPQSSG